MSNNTSRNQAYFNDKAASYDEMYEVTLAELNTAIRARRAFIGVDWVEEDVTARDDRSVRLLDYACGTGSVSRALAPYVTQCIGVDLSPNMVVVYNSRAYKEGFSEERMKAIQGNVLDTSPESQKALSGPSLWGFDIAAVGLGAHHFDDPTLVVTRLVERLRPGGVLFISDLTSYEVPKEWLAQNHGHHHHHHHHGHKQTEEHGGHGIAAGKEEGETRGNKTDHDGTAPPKGSVATITHHGFTEAQVKEMFERAGASKDFAFELVKEVDMPPMDGVERTVFFARGTKA